MALIFLYVYIHGEVDKSVSSQRCSTYFAAGLPCALLGLFCSEMFGCSSAAKNADMYIIYAYKSILQTPPAGSRLVSSTWDTHIGEASWTFHQGLKSPSSVAVHEVSSTALPSTALLATKSSHVLLWVAGRNRAKFSPDKNTWSTKYHFVVYRSIQKGKDNHTTKKTYFKWVSIF